MAIVLETSNSSSGGGNIESTLHPRILRQEEAFAGGPGAAAPSANSFVSFEDMGGLEMIESAVVRMFRILYYRGLNN